MQLLTTAEAASYLRLKERKIYEMVADGTVPCTKVTGRWLFPKAELDHWLASSVSRPPGLIRPEPAPIVGGSHDPLLEWALRESGSGLATLAVGSEAGLERFVASETIAASMHLHALENPNADANVAAMATRTDMQDAVMIGFCRREQGFLLAPGNPYKIDSIEDVISKRARICMRPKGSGAQLLLLSLLHRAKVTLDKLAAVLPVCPTGPDIAQAIRAGRADAGIATRSPSARQTSCTTTVSAPGGITAPVMIRTHWPCCNSFSKVLPANADPICFKRTSWDDERSAPRTA